MLHKLRCFFGRHEWCERVSYSDGVPLPPGYKVRRCLYCGARQWNIIDPKNGGMEKIWIRGEPPHPKPNNPPPPQGRVGVSARGVRTVEMAYGVVHIEEPGLNSDERGTL